MKFLVLRTDLKKKLKYIRLIVVNADIFEYELQNGTDSITENIDTDSFNDILLEKVRIAVCSQSANGSYENFLDGSGIKYLSLDGLSYAEIIERLSEEYGVNKSQIAFLNNSDTDLNLLSGLSFSVATTDAPLDVKTVSYYVSNSTGSEALNEIVRIVASAKNS